MSKIILYLFFIVLAFLLFKKITLGWRPSSFDASNLTEDRGGLVDILESHVFYLSERIGDRSVFKYQKLQEAEQYITEQFNACGYNVEFQEYSVYNKKSKNIIATKIGKIRPEEVVIVGAHYDTCFNPGADDNASAVAGLLELAKALSDQPTNRTIRFVAFVNEEPPFFKTPEMGSRVYVKIAKERKEDIKAVIILEMIGYYSSKKDSQKYPPLFGLFYPNKANFICVVGNWNSNWLVREVRTGFKKGTEFPIETFVGPSFIAGVDYSDHWSFWKEGLPAVMITDTAFYRNPHYHSASDTYEKLDYKSMAEVVRGLESVLIELAK